MGFHHSRLEQYHAVQHDEARYVRLLVAGEPRMSLGAPRVAFVWLHRSSTFACILNNVGGALTIRGMQMYPGLHLCAWQGSGYSIANEELCQAHSCCTSGYKSVPPIVKVPPKWSTMHAKL